MSDLEQRALAAFLDLVDAPYDEVTSKLQKIKEEDEALAARVSVLLRWDAQPSALDETRVPVDTLLGNPSEIGNYKIIRRLGEGGMGTVFLAERDVDGTATQVAIKLIRRDRVSNSAISRFLSERRHLASLDHPCICRFIDASRLPDGSPFVVMEAIDGEPLLDYCAQNQLGLIPRIELLLAITDAVAHAHSRLVVHRDIKASNVLVTRNGSPKLLDFGIAKSLSDTNATATADRFLTPSASSPEQWLGESIGASCDVYGLGLLAFEVLTDCLPFDFENKRASEIENLILHVAPPLASSVSKHPFAKRLRGDVDAIVETCLRKLPKHRYPNAAALANDLSCFLQNRPVSARPIGIVDQLGLFARRHRLPVALASVSVLITIAGVAGLWAQSLALESQRNEALLERDRAREVVTILEQSFLGADPARSDGDRITARNILDTATPKILALRNTQPKLFAELAETIASVEVGLSADARAISLTDAVLQLGPDESIDGRTLNRVLATAMLANARAGNRDRAQELLQMRLGREPGLSPAERLIEARIAMYASKGEAAHKAFDKLIAEIAAAPQDNDLAFEAHFMRAENFRMMGQYESAIEAFVALDRALASSLSEIHPLRLRTRLREMIAQSQSGRVAESLDRFAEVVGHIEAHYGAMSIVTADAHAAFGSALRAAGDKPRAVEHLQRAVNVSKIVLGMGHHNTQRITMNFALLLREIDPASEQALSLFSDLVAATQASFGNHRPITIYARTNLAEVMANRGEVLSALRVMAIDETQTWHQVASEANRKHQLTITERLLATDACRRPDSSETHAACERLVQLRDNLNQSLTIPPNP